MGDAPPAPAAIGSRKEPSIDPVKAEGILSQYEKLQLEPKFRRTRVIHQHHTNSELVIGGELNLTLTLRRGPRPCCSVKVKVGSCAEVSRKNKNAARLWHQRWGFYTRLREIQEEEALKAGFTLEEYRAALRSVSCQPEPEQCHVEVEPCTTPLPPTTSGMIGRRALYPLERYGRLVKTPRDYPIRPPLPPGQIYDPYKQTFVFLGSVSGDPISYKLPPARCDVTDEMLARPQQLHATQISEEVFKKALAYDC